jgi:alkylhydroperoxidase/carboxymuconolactone decarboxylase family protein YurZ
VTSSNDLSRKPETLQKEANAMETRLNSHPAEGCGCSQPKTVTQVEPVGPRTERPLEPRLEDLVPIAVVIAAGCETCAERMVARALEQGSPVRHIRKVLAVVAQLRGSDCFAQAVGLEAVAKMDLPLAAGRRTLGGGVRTAE